MTKPLAIPNLVLIGPPGSGKTTVGKLLAGWLSWNFVDVDALVERRVRCTIAELFGGPGEAYFRQLEHQTLCDLAARKNHVIATGGGIVIRPDNWPVLHECGWIVALLAPAGELARRLWPERQGRPLLRDVQSEEELAARLEAILSQRLPLYRQANTCLEIGGRPAEEVADEIFQQPVVQHVLSRAED